MLIQDDHEFRSERIELRATCQERDRSRPGCKARCAVSSLRPNLQYVILPGGTGKIPDAFVIGLYAHVILRATNLMCLAHASNQACLENGPGAFIPDA